MNWLFHLGLRTCTEAWCKRVPFSSGIRVMANQGMEVSHDREQQSCTQSHALSRTLPERTSVDRRCCADIMITCCLDYSCDRKPTTFHGDVITETERVFPLLHELNVLYHKQRFKPRQARREPVPIIGHGRFPFLPERWQEAEEVSSKGRREVGEIR